VFTFFFLFFRYGVCVFFVFFFCISSPFVFFSPYFFFVFYVLSLLFMFLFFFFSPRVILSVLPLFYSFFPFSISLRSLPFYFLSSFLSPRSPFWTPHCVSHIFYSFSPFYYFSCFFQGFFSPAALWRHNKPLINLRGHFFSSCPLFVFLFAYQLTMFFFPFCLAIFHCSSSLFGVWVVLFFILFVSSSLRHRFLFILI